MKYDEAIELEVGDVVAWDRKPQDLGVVTAVAPIAFHVRWRNGQEGWISFLDAGPIDKVPRDAELPFTDPPEGGERPQGQEAGDGTL